MESNLVANVKKEKKKQQQQKLLCIGKVVKFSNMKNGITMGTVRYC